MRFSHSCEQLRAARAPTYRDLLQLIANSFALLVWCRSAFPMKFLSTLFVMFYSIALTGCVNVDNSGAAVAAQWNARFNGATPWSGGAPTMSVADFVYEGIAVKDYEYKRYVDLLRRGTSWSGFGAQTASIGLNTAGTLTTSGTTKILSGIAGAITGTSAAFGKNVLFDQSITTFIGRMDKLRVEKLSEIQNKLNSKSYRYGYAEAYRDIQDYGHKGSLDAALTDVAKNND